MHFLRFLRACQRLLLVILCMSLVFPLASAKNYSSELCLSSRKIHSRQLNENSSARAVAEVAQTRAYLSPAVLLGTLKSLLVQRDGTVRAWFTVNSPLKLNTTRSRSSRREDTEVVYYKSGTSRCVLELNQDKLVLGNQYLVFGAPWEKNSRPSMTATALPIPNEKRTLRAVKKLLCKGCAKPPSLSGLQRLKLEEGRRVRLNCHLAGYPIPWVEWYKDGIRLLSRGRLKVRTKRRTSRLIIRVARPSDRGVYECRAGNVVQDRPVALHATLTITRKRTTLRPRPTPSPTIPSTQSSPWTTEPCPTSDFCLNGGTCIFYKVVREFVCHCADGFVGLRCDFKDVNVSLSGFKNIDLSNGRLFIHILILFLIFFCLNWASAGVCWLCCFRCERVNWGKVRGMASLQRFFRDRKTSGRDETSNNDYTVVDENALPATVGKDGTKVTEENLVMTHGVQERNLNHGTIQS